MTNDPLAADVQKTIDDFGIRLRPLVSRCKCGQRISDNRIACRACTVAARDALVAPARKMIVDGHGDVREVVRRCGGSAESEADALAGRAANLPSGQMDARIGRWGG